MVYAGVVLMAGGAALVALYRLDILPDRLSLNDALQVFGHPGAANPFKDASALPRSAHVRIGSRSLDKLAMDEVGVRGSAARSRAGAGGRRMVRKL